MRRFPAVVAGAVFAGAGVVGLVPAQASAQVTTTIVAKPGDAAPGGGTFRAAYDPVVNDAGQVAFSAGIAGDPRNVDLYRATGSTIVPIVRTGQPSPDGNGTISAIFPDALADNGQLLFRLRLDNTSPDSYSLVRGDGGSLVQIARTGQLVPGGNGRFDSFQNVVDAINDVGQAAFAANLLGTSGGASDNTAIYRHDGAVLVPLVRAGQTVPGGDGRFARINGLGAFNDVGQAAFLADVTGTAGAAADGAGLFRSNGVTAVQLARAGELAPDGNSRFSAFDHPSLNDAGQAAYRAELFGTTGGAADRAGIFRSDGTATVRIVRAGQSAPGGDGVFADVQRPTINAAGQVAFFGALSGAAGGAASDTGVFRGDGNSIVQILREGQAAPDGNGHFGDFQGSYLVNDAGQTAFAAGLDGTRGGAADNFGLFVFDDRLGLVQVACTGDPMLGSVLAGISMITGSFNIGDEPTGFNNLGQIAYEFTLADGRTGVALATVGVPEPMSTVATLALPAAIVLLRRRSRAAQG